MFIICLILVIIGGVFMSFQSPTNATLSGYVGHFQASVLSFGGGVLILLIASALNGTGNLSLLFTAQPWQMTGGLYGAYVVLIVTYAAPVLGIALTLTIIMLGQLIMGLAIDQFGLFLSEQIEVTFLRIVGIIIVAAGIIIVYFGNKGSNKSAAASKKAIIIGFLCLLAGIGGAVQIPTNASLAVIIGQTEGALISFAGGFLILLIITLIINKGRFGKIKGIGVKPWMLLGGLYGAAGVLFNLIAAPYTGIVLVTIAGMLGQIGGALIVDNFGFFRTQKIHMNKMRYLGFAVIAAGLIIVSAARI